MLAADPHRLPGIVCACQIDPDSARSVTRHGARHANRASAVAVSSKRGSDLLWMLWTSSLAPLSRHLSPTGTLDPLFGPYSCPCLISPSPSRLVPTPVPPRSEYCSAARLGIIHFLLLRLFGLSGACPQVNTPLRTKQKKTFRQRRPCVLTMIFIQALSSLVIVGVVLSSLYFVDIQILPKSSTSFVQPRSLARFIKVPHSCIKFFRLVSLRWDIFHTCSVTASTFLPVGSQVSVCRSEHCLSSSS